MVSCLPPSARLSVPTRVLSTPSTVTAAGSSISTGGQAFAQSPAQLDVGGLEVSLSKRYNDMPAPSTTMLPSWPAAATASLDAAATAWVLVSGAAAGATCWSPTERPETEPFWPHAATPPSA